MEYDIVIVGGGFAGQAAALQLGRARRRVLLLDAGQQRNRFAESSHGFLGQDGQPPGAIMETARAQLARYQTVAMRAGRATGAQALGAGFRVALADGGDVAAARLILATGVRDDLPPLPGLAARWGVSVLHCPYCHGFELDQQPLGVLAGSPMALHQAMLVPDWGPTTLFTQGVLALAPEQEAALAARGVVVETCPVAELLGDGQRLDGVRLADGRTIPVAALFVAPRTLPASDLAGELGCAFEQGPSGPFVQVDARQATSVPGVFAAGDAASPMANATLAAAAGVMAAAGAHHSLIHGLGAHA